MKYLLTFLFIASYVCVFSQFLTEDEHLELNLDTAPASIKNDDNFRKAYDFFENESYDSTLIYTYQFLIEHPKESVYTEYCHYFRGISFISKNLQEEAKLELSKIGTKFPYYLSVVMKLGSIALDLEDYTTALEYLKELENNKDLEPTRKATFCKTLACVICI